MLQNGRPDQHPPTTLLDTKRVYVEKLPSGLCLQEPLFYVLLASRYPSRRPKYHLIVTIRRSIELHCTGAGNR